MPGQPGPKTLFPSKEYNAIPFSSNDFQISAARTLGGRSKDEKSAEPDFYTVRRACQAEEVLAERLLTRDINRDFCRAALFLWMRFPWVALSIRENVGDSSLSTASVSFSEMASLIFPNWVRKRLILLRRAKRLRSF